MKKLVFAGIYLTGNKEYVKGRAEVAWNAMSGSVRGSFSPLIGETEEYRGE